MTKSEEKASMQLHSRHMWLETPDQTRNPIVETKMFKEHSKGRHVITYDVIGQRMV